MPGPWDSLMKKLLQTSFRDFIAWFTSGAHFVAEESPHLQNRNIDTDALYQVEVDGENFLLHIEFQKRSDPAMARRIWEYNVLATCKFQIPVFSIVVYLQKAGKSAQSPYVWTLPDGKPVHTFHFNVIELWTLSTEELFSYGWKGLLPLAPLTREGKSRQVIERIIEELNPAGQKPETELLALTYGLASLVFTEVEDHQWLEWRFNMLEEILAESWAFKGIMEKGHEAGRQEGRKEGLETGLQQGLETGLQQGLETGRQEEIQRAKLLLKMVLEARLPECLPLLEEHDTKFNSPELLHILNCKVQQAKTANEFKDFLVQLNIIPEQNDSTF